MLTRFTLPRGINDFVPENTSLRKSLFLRIKFINFDWYLHHILRRKVELELFSEVFYEVTFGRKLAKQFVWNHRTLFRSLVNLNEDFIRFVFHRA